MMGGICLSLNGIEFIQSLIRPTLCVLNPRSPDAMAQYATHTLMISPGSLLEVRSRQRLNHTRTLTKSRSENPVGVYEHAVFQRDDDELRTLESSLDESTDILCVREIEGCINLVENVHWCWLELQECHDEGDCDERSAQCQQSLISNGK